MAVPKKRTTSAKRDRRRSHHGAAKLSIGVCAKCNSAVPSHRACANCGTYKGREVVDVLKKLDKKEKKAKEKELEQEEHDHS